LEKKEVPFQKPTLKKKRGKKKWGGGAPLLCLIISGVEAWKKEEAVEADIFLRNHSTVAVGKRTPADLSTFLPITEVTGGKRRIEKKKHGVEEKDRD